MLIFEEFLHKKHNHKDSRKKKAWFRKIVCGRLVAGIESTMVNEVCESCFRNWMCLKQSFARYRVFEKQIPKTKILVQNFKNFMAQRLRKLSVAQTCRNLEVLAS